MSQLEVDGPGRAMRAAVSVISLVLISLVALTSGCSDQGSEPKRVVPTGLVAPAKVEIPVDLPLRRKVQVILAAPDPMQRVKEIIAVLEASDLSDVPTLKAAFELSPLDHGDLEIVLFGEWWARYDPEAAFYWSESNWRADHPRVSSAIVRAWARRDPVSAYENGLMGMNIGGGSPILRAEILDAVVAGWFESGQPGLLPFATSLPSIGDQHAALRTIARLKLNEVGAQLGFDWMLTVEGLDEKGRLALLQGATSVAAKMDPVVAVEMVEYLDRVMGEPILGLYNRVGGIWAENDPEGAMTWLITLPDGVEKNRGVNRAMATWLRKDPAAATVWIDQIEDKDAAWTDDVYNMYVRVVVFNKHYDVDFPEIFAWAEDHMKNPRLLEGAVAWATQRWYIIDPEAADAWMAKSPILSDHVKQKLKNEISDKLRRDTLKHAGLIESEKVKLPS